MSSGIEVKICGITHRDDARAAVDGGADYIGFVFHAGSPRAIKPLAVAQLLDGLDRPIRAVGVFVNERPETVAAVARDCRLYAVQLHGDESPIDAGGLSVAVWRAVWWRGRWEPDPADWNAARFVADAAPKGVYGGSGVQGNWDRAAELARRHPVMLAGGLTPDNVGEAIRQVRPAGVDVVSGIELRPGRKDLRKMKAFLARAKGIIDGSPT